MKSMQGYSAFARFVQLLILSLSLIASLGVHRAQGEGIYSNSWVHPSPTGNLLYRHDANGVRIGDFSDCGYKGGAQELPDARLMTPEQDRWIDLFPSVGANDAILLQNALNTIGAKSLKTNGFRGVVFLNAGEYKLDRTIFITNSGIILKGVGSSGAGRSTLRATAKFQYNMLAITGLVERADIGAPQIPIINPVVPSGSRTFKVFDPLDLKVGDSILVTRPFTAEWISKIDMDQLITVSCPIGATSTNQCTFSGRNWDTGRKLVFERKITRIEGLWITVDSPLAQTFDLQYGGGFVERTTWPERINNLGVEDIEMVTDYGDDDDEDHGWVAIEVQNAEDVWVKNVVGKHFGMSLVNLSYGTRHATVTDCQNYDPISKLEGNRRYPFQMHKGDHHLVRDCYSDDGRHDFAFGSLVPGPNANVRCQTHESHADSGPHLGWAVGGLYDLISLDASWGAGFLDKVGINVQNRGRNTKDHGWAGAYMTVWNCVAPNFRVRNPPTARNWLIGSIGLIYDSQWWLPPVGDDPDGTYEWSGPPIPLPQFGQPTLGHQVEPYSLYFAQLQQRLKWPQSEFREYRLGDIDDFGGSPSPEDRAPVDPAFLKAVRDNAGTLRVSQNFDDRTPNRQMAFTFTVPLKGAERVVAASLVLCMKSVGNTDPFDVLYLDSATVGTPMQAKRGYDWDIRKDAPSIETLEVDPALLSDGKLNVSIKQNIALDWAVLHVQVSTAAYTELALPPIGDTYVRGGSHKQETHGGESSLWVKDEDDGDFSRRTYFNFAVPTLPRSLVGAKIRLYCNGTGDPKNVFYVARARHDDWGEGSMNWFNQPGNLPPFAYFVPKTEGFVEISVLPQVLDAMARHRRLPLQIWAPYDLGDAGFTSFASKEDPDKTRRPQLIFQLKDEPPTMSPLTNVTFVANTQFGPLPITLNDVETPVSGLILTASSSNPTLIQSGGIVLGGSGSTRTLLLKPVANQTGFAEITVYLNDGMQTVSQTFTARVGPPLTPPMLSSISNQSLMEHTPSPRIPFTITDTYGRARQIEASISAALVSRRSQLAIHFGSEDDTNSLSDTVSHRFLTITPLPGFTGNARITVQISDGFNVVTQPVSVTVTPIDDPPGPIRMAEPAPGTTFPTNQPLVLQAIVEDSEHDLARVEFYNRTNFLGALTTPPFRLSWQNPQAGTQPINAIAIDNAGHRTASDEVQFQIGPESEAPPLLKILSTEGTLQIGWDVESGNFRLQSADSLKAPLLWTDVSRLQSAPTGGVSVAIEPGVKERFYRLYEVP